MPHRLGRIQPETFRDALERSTFVLVQTQDKVGLPRATGRLYFHRDGLTHQAVFVKIRWKYEWKYGSLQAKCKREAPRDETHNRGGRGRHRLGRQRFPRTFVVLRLNRASIGSPRLRRDIRRARLLATVNEKAQNSS
jgi:hypothetical protein